MDRNELSPIELERYEERQMMGKDLAGDALSVKSGDHSYTEFKAKVRKCLHYVYGEGMESSRKHYLDIATSVKTEHKEKALAAFIALSNEHPEVKPFIDSYRKRLKCSSQQWRKHTPQQMGKYINLLRSQNRILMEALELYAGIGPNVGGKAIEAIKESKSLLQRGND